MSHKKDGRASTPKRKSQNSLWGMIQFLCISIRPVAISKEKRKKTVCAVTTCFPIAVLPNRITRNALWIIQGSVEYLKGAFGAKFQRNTLNLYQVILRDTESCQVES